MRGLMLAVLLLAMAMSAMADVLVMKSGRTVTGSVVAEDQQTVTFESKTPGMAVREVFKRAEIASITKPQAVSGPSYFEIPVMGVVGQEIKAKALAEAMAAARRAQASYVVLLFDSPGGLIPECIDIVEVMDANRDLETIAFVKNAQSAAAVIASTCKTIVMHPMGQVGAAVPFRIDMSRPIPIEVNEKLTSSFRARARSAATIGGHEPALLMGMIDTQVELYAVEAPEGVTVSEFKTKGAVVLKPKGKILTLTADEAVKYGLAKGICRSMRDVGKQVDIEDWTSCGPAGREIMGAYASADRAGRAFDEREQGRQELRKEIDQVLELLKIRSREAEEQIDLYKSELERLDREFKDITRSLPPASSLYQRYQGEYENRRQTLEREQKLWQDRLDQCRKAMHKLEG